MTGAAESLAGMLCGSDSAFGDVHADLLASAHFARISAALAVAQTPFLTAEYGDRFRRCAIDGVWFLQSLASNAAKEADGAEDLWRLHIALRQNNVTRVSDLPWLLRRHALDEVRHVRYYFAFAGLCFSEIIRPPMVRELGGRLSPALSEVPAASEKLASIEGVFDLVLQVNLGEIRTRIHQRLMQPCLLELCPPAKRVSLAKLIDRLARDEMRHVAYTTEVLDRLSRSMTADQLSAACARWACRFSEYTMVELGSQGLAAAEQGHLSL